MFLCKSYKYGDCNFVQRTMILILKLFNLYTINKTYNNPLFLYKSNKYGDCNFEQRTIILILKLFNSYTINKTYNKYKYKYKYIRVKLYITVHWMWYIYIYTSCVIIVHLWCNGFTSTKFLWYERTRRNEYKFVIQL